MAEVSFLFGGRTVTIEVPDQNLAEVLRPQSSKKLPNLDDAIRQSLDQPIAQKPIEEWVKPSSRVVIVSDDNTRQTPAHLLVPPLIDRLNSAGVPDHKIECIMALGTHRYMSDDEMKAKVGSAVFRRIKVFNHEWRNPSVLVNLGISKRGTPLIVNRAVVEADVVIGLGTIVPHHIPGFSGSSKIIQPGISGAVTTAATHILACDNDDSYLGHKDNPVRRDMDNMADMVGMKTILNVVLNCDGEVAGVYFGAMRPAFEQGAIHAQTIYGVEYSQIPDIAIVNSHPCNIDFWQSHKALYPAQRMVRPGGTIIICTPAPEGISPVHTDLLNITSWSSDRIRDAYQRGKLKNGVATALAIAWAKVREKAKVITYSPGISPKEKSQMGHTHAPDIQWAIDEALRQEGPNARISVLSHAPETLPLLKSPSKD